MLACEPPSRWMTRAGLAEGRLRFEQCRSPCGAPWLNVIAALMADWPGQFRIGADAAGLTRRSFAAARAALAGQGGGEATSGHAAGPRVGTRVGGARAQAAEARGSGAVSFGQGRAHPRALLSSKTGAGPRPDAGRDDRDGRQVDGTGGERGTTVRAGADRSGRTAGSGGSSTSPSGTSTRRRPSRSRNHR